jgi:two-component system, chemotaxis family, sensor kinase Cph1
MKPITDFFSGLFDTQLWPPRWQCGYWSDFQGWLYITSDLMIWLAYFMIPVIIFRYVAKRKQVIKFSGVYLLFAAFILLCGTTHFLDACMFWVPMYRLNALVRFITGLVSLFTVYYLIKILPDAFRQKTSIELENEIERRKLAERRLEEVNQNLDTFAYVASHDLQEPLRKIKTFSSMLYDANEHIFTDESKILAGKIQRSTDRMQTLIRDVLSLSTISNSISFEEVNLEEVIKEVREDLEIKIQEKDAIIEIARLPLVKGNKNYLNQLFSNLISNAIKFTDKQPRIQISGIQKIDGVIIQVTDNGIGINEKDLKKIFDAFSRLNAIHEFEGSGIGLTICKKIVSLHYGTIEVESTAGHGTTFFVSLPSA